MEKHAKESEVWIEYGRRLAESGRWDDAAKAFESAVEFAPKDAPVVWLGRGRAYAELGKWDEAAENFAKVLDLIPQLKPDPNRYFWWAEHHGIDEVIVRYAEVYDRLARLRPKNLALVARRQIT